MKERMIPNNIDAEICLLGSILLDNEALDLVRDYVTTPHGSKPGASG